MSCSCNIVLTFRFNKGIAEEMKAITSKITNTRYGKDLGQLFNLVYWRENEKWNYYGSYRNKGCIKTVRDWEIGPYGVSLKQQKKNALDLMAFLVFVGASNNTVKDFASAWAKHHCDFSPDMLASFLHVMDPKDPFYLAIKKRGREIQKLLPTKHPFQKFFTVDPKHYNCYDMIKKRYNDSIDIRSGLIGSLSDDLVF